MHESQSTGEPVVYFPAWLFEKIDAKGVTLYCWLGFNGHLPPHRRTPEVIAPLIGWPRRAVAEQLAALRAAGGLDADNRVQLYPPAGEA